MRNHEIAKNAFACFLCFMLQLSSFQIAHALESSELAVGSVKWAENITVQLERMSEISADDRGIIEKYAEQVDSLIKDNSDNPVYWFLRGRLIRAELKSYFDENRERFKERGSFNNDPYVIKRREELTLSYKNAIEKDALGVSEMKLSRNMLSAISGNFGMPYELRISALRRELLLGEPEGAENYRYNRYSEIIGIYIGHNQFDAALSVLDEMEEKFPHMADELEQARADVLTRKQKYQTELVKKEEEKAVAEESKQEKSIAQQQPVSKPAPQPAPETTDPYAGDEAEYRQWILILALIAIGLAVVIYILRRPRK